MREIKYRAFLKNRKFIVDVVSISFNRYITWYDGRQTREVEPSPMYEVEGYDDIILMQFTGLKDKNGKEIWEGDIVTTGPEEWESNYEIVWNPKELCFGMQADEGILQVGFWIDNPHRGLEVIGNIHENPELLNQ